MNAIGSEGVRRIEVEGRALVVKSSVGRGRALLRREADILAAVSGTGIVSLVALRESDDATHLVLEDAGGHDLASFCALGDWDLTTVLDLLRDTAATLASVQRRGWVHGAVCSEHIVIDIEAEATATLCSWSSARPSDDPFDHAADVADLVAVAVAVIGSGPVRWRIGELGERLASRRLIADLEAAGGADSPLEPTDRAEAVTRVLDSAIAARKPRLRANSAREVVNRFADGAAGIVTGAVAGIGTRRRAAPVRRVLGRPVAAAVITAGLVTTGLALVNLQRPGPAPTIDLASRPLDVTVAASGEAECAAGISDEARIELDGDGCPGPIQIDGPFVRADGIEFEIGSAGDVLAAGDFLCSGDPVIRLLRPTTGEIYEFAGWTISSEPLTGELIALATGATSLAAKPSSGCDEMELTDSAGADVAPTDPPDGH